MASVLLARVGYRLLQGAQVLTHDTTGTAVIVMTRKYVCVSLERGCQHCGFRRYG